MGPREKSEIMTNNTKERMLVYHAWNSFGLVRNHHYKFKEGTKEFWLQVEEFPMADSFARLTMVDRADPDIINIGVIDTSITDAETVIRTFERKVKMTTSEFIEEYEKYRTVCPTCGRAGVCWDIGYPNEILIACSKCGRILDCSFDNAHID